MKKRYFLKTSLFLLLLITVSSCASDDGGYTEIPEEESPVVVDLSAVPYGTLSEYKFYKGEMGNLEPAAGVVPYDLNSALFTDYAHKKRFVWMPKGVKATYSADGKVLNFPAGAVLIKNFYYENVQPANTTRIIETRLMIKKADGWIFANYVWNNEQTEAFLNTDGGATPVSWTEGGQTRSINYIIPSEADCFTCHKLTDPSVDNTARAIPIGPKPQNLNKLYPYTDGSKNQLAKWVEAGYLESVPFNIASTIDWTDTSQPLELRARSYLDINCAHCHTEGAHCDYRPLRLSFTETQNPVNIGICVQPHEQIPGNPYIVTASIASKSVMYYRMNSTLQDEMMPIIGRTLIHSEGAGLIEEWINAMESQCP